MSNKNIFFSLVCGLLFLAHQTNGQIMDSILFEQEFYPPEDTFEEEWDPGNIFGINISYLPVFFENSVDVYVNVTSSFVLSGHFELKVFAGENQVGPSLILNSDTKEFVIENLEPNFEYTLVANMISEGEGIVEMGVAPSNIKTIRHRALELSDPLYRAIAQFSSGSFEMPLSDFLVENQGDFHLHEVAGFAQHHFNIEYLIRDFSNGLSSITPPWFGVEWPPRPDFDDPEEPDTGGDDGGGDGDGDGDGICECTFLMNSTHYETPGDRLRAPYNGSSKPFLGNTSIPGLLNSTGNRGSSRKALFTAFGPSKHKSIRLKATGSSNRVHTLTTQGYDQRNDASYQHTSPIYARHAYNFLCTGHETQLPENCDCSKTILVDYNYCADLFARPSVGTFRGQAVASAEDLAVLAIGRMSTQQIEVVDAGRARVETSCRRDVNGDFIINYLKLNSSLALFILGLEGSNELPSQETIDGMIDQFETVLNTPFFKTDEACDDFHEWACLIANPVTGSLPVDLYSNDPVNIVLSSYSHVHARARRHAHSRAAIHSSFFLSTIALPSESEGKDFCCSDKLARYSIGYVQEYPDREYMNLPLVDENYNVSGYRKVIVPVGEQQSPHQRNDLKTKVGAVLALWAPWGDIETDFYGNYILPFDCFRYLEPNLNCDNITTWNLVAPENEATFTVPSIESKVFPNPVIDNLTIESESPIKKMLIFDIQGRLIADKEIGGVKHFDTQIFSKLTPGKYHLQLISKDGIDVHNLIKN